jgi:hypothetical protein
MKLSKRTLAILENFSAINGVMTIRPGSVLRSRASTETIDAVASVDEHFETECTILSLTKLCSILKSTGPEAELTFHPGFVEVSKGTQSWRLSHAALAAAYAAGGYKEVNYSKAVPVVGCLLQWADISQWLAAASLYGQELAIEWNPERGEKDALVVATRHETKPTHDRYCHRPPPLFPCQCR